MNMPNLRKVMCLNCRNCKHVLEVFINDEEHNMISDVKYYCNHDKISAWVAVYKSKLSNFEQLEPYEVCLDYPQICDMFEQNS